MHLSQFGGLRSVGWDSGYGKNLLLVQRSSHGRRVQRALGRHFYKDTNPFHEDSTFESLPKCPTTKYHLLGEEVST